VLIPIFEDEYEFTVIFEIFFIIIYVIRLIIIKRIEGFQNREELSRLLNAAMLNKKIVQSA
jgi:hypothetical protein